MIIIIIYIVIYNYNIYKVGYRDDRNVLQRKIRLEFVS